MPDVLPQLAQDHVDAIHALAEHLMELCPDRYTADTHQRVDALLKSFARFNGSGGEDGAMVEVLVGDRYRDGLGRNYVTAQCALLLAFAHQVSRAAACSDIDGVRYAIDGLWKSVASCHQMFFGTALPPAQ